MFVQQLSHTVYYLIRNADKYEMNSSTTDGKLPYYTSFTTIQKFQRSAATLKGSSTPLTNTERLKSTL